MGKSKKKKFSAPKNRPTGLPSVGELVSEMEMSTTTETSPAALQSLIEKLQSPHMECRECACATLANLVSEPGAIAALMKLNIVKILGPLVLDPSWDIKHRAVGALRNMSVDGGSDVCEKMVASDVMTPLLVFIKQFGKDDQISGDTKSKHVEVVHEAYTHAFYLLLNLCESSNLAVNLFNRENLSSILCPIMDSDKYGLELKISLGEFLYTISDDNAELYKPELRESLLKCISNTDTSSSESLLLRTLMTGVLVNFEGAKLATAHGSLIVSIISTVSDILSKDISESVQALIGTINTTEQKEDEDKGKEARETELKNLKNLLHAQQVALEFVTNLCCSEDEEWEDVNVSESSSDDAMETVDDAMETDNQLQTSLCVSTELHSAIVQSGIVSKVLQGSQPLSEDQGRALQSVPGGGDISNKVVRKQIHALLCLSNLVGSLDVEAFGGVDRLHGIWQGLSQISITQYCIESQELLEAVTNAMRAVIQKLTETDPSKFQEVNPADLQFMEEMATKCQWSEVRVNALRVVAAIGTVLAQGKGECSLLKTIGVLFLKAVCSDSDVWVRAEALDAIFDVFGEDHLDPVVREIELVEKLKMVQPQLKSMFQASRKTQGDHYPVISSARTNLVRFIQYKSKRH